MTGPRTAFRTASALRWSGTVQTIQPLNHGELKLTLAKFYRVSGQSTQHQGVLPDIAYPSIIDASKASAGSYVCQGPLCGSRTRTPQPGPFSPRCG